MKRAGIKIAVILLLAFLLPVFSGTDTKAAAAPDWSDDACYGSGNPLTAGYKNQCTWYVWGRVRECLGRGEQKYYTRTMSPGDFAATTKSRVSGCTILKYIPLTKQDTGEVPAVAVYTGTADNITETNAKLHGSVSKPAGTRISYCGIYLGTDMNHMIKQKTEAVGSSANNKDNGTGFDIWYDLGSELSVTLSRGTLPETFIR